MTTINPHYNTMTKQQVTRLAIEALVRTNPDIAINRLVEIVMGHDPMGSMLDALLKGFAVDVQIVDEDMLRDKAIRTFVDIQPFEYAHAFARLCDDCVYINVSHQCGVDDDTLDPIYDHKETRIRLEDAADWGIVVHYV